MSPDTLSRPCQPGALTQRCPSSQADSSGVITPGTPFSVPFSVMSHWLGGNFTVRATNSRLFALIFPTSLDLQAGERANATVTIVATGNIPSGTDVTLTIDVEAPGGQDANYAVLRFSVMNTVTLLLPSVTPASLAVFVLITSRFQAADVTAPVCQLISLQANCPQNCTSSRWTLSVRVSDEAGGTGVANVTVKTGDGTLDASIGDVTLVSYNASCCSPKVELLVVDKVGNTGTCLYSLSSRVTPSAWLCLIAAVLGVLIKT